MADSRVAGGGTRPGVLVVGYRRSPLFLSCLPVLVLLFGTIYTGFLMFGLKSVFLALLFVVFALVTLLFVPLYLRAVVRVLIGRPLLTLDGDGVAMHSARIRLPWSNVAEIRIDHTRSGRPAADMIVFVPRDEREVLATHRRWSRRFARDGIRRHGGPIFLRASVLACPIEKILAAAGRSAPVPVRHRHKV